MFRCSRPEFTAALKQFYDHLQLNGRAALISYARAVRDLMEMTGKLPLELKEREIIEHLTRLHDSRGLSSSALNARISALKYLYREVLRRLDIVVDLPNPRRTRLVTELLTGAEVRQLFAGTNSVKHLAILHLLFDTGLRAREVANLRVCDFDAKAGTLRVVSGKGGKHRVVPYGQQTRETLLEYWRQERPTDRLFTARRPTARRSPCAACSMSWRRRTSAAA